MNKPKDLRRNVRCRQAVMELLSLAPDLAVPPQDQDKFWELLAEEAAARVAKVLVEDKPMRIPMTDKEAQLFSQRTVPHGVHKGKRIIDVDPSYWLFLTEGDFQRELVLYVRSPFFRRLQ